jgi:hypothetical protein
MRGHLFSGDCTAAANDASIKVHADGAINTVPERRRSRQRRHFVDGSGREGARSAKSSAKVPVSKLIEGKHEPLVSIDLWERVRSRRNQEGMLRLLPLHWLRR